MGMERILIALEAEGIDMSDPEELDAYVLCLDESAALEAFKITTELRAAGYRSDMDYLNRSFKAQFKTVDRKKAKAAILIGETEVKNQSVTIKRIDDQTQVSVPMGDLIDAMDSMFAMEDEHEHTCTCGEGNCTCGNHE